jgi:hypothetical protein
VARNAANASEMLEEANERAIIREAQRAAQSEADGLLCSDDFLTRHGDDAKRSKAEYTHPDAPDAQRASLWDGHDKAGVVGESAPSRQDSQCALVPDHNDDIVVAIHMDRVKSALMATYSMLEAPTSSWPAPSRRAVVSNENGVLYSVNVLSEEVIDGLAELLSHIGIRVKPKIHSTLEARRQR